MRRDDRRAAPPRVVHFDRDRANAVEVGEELYMFLAADEAALVPARCPHRGGPLHLASVEHGGKGVVLVCPWHQTKVPLRALRARAVATVQSGAAVSAVIEAPADVAIIPRQVPLHLAPTSSCSDGCFGGGKGHAP